MELVLPSLFSELSGQALPKIVLEISRVNYLNHVVIDLDRANREEFEQAFSFFKTDASAILYFVENGWPRLQAIHNELSERNLAPTELGKGRNVWYCIGYVNARAKAEAVGLHDCDITTYNRQLLARLFYPIANPNFHFEFCKDLCARC